MRGLPLRGVRLAFAALAFALTLTTAAGSQESRIIAVGDVHGTPDALRAILRTAGVIDLEDRWAGGDTTFVQTGDLMDRGHGVRDLLDLMIDLDEQAPAAGGRVISLLGNHEMGNLVGYYDPNSNSPEAFAAIVGAFAADEPPKLRKRAVAEWRRWSRRFAHCTVESKNDWLASRPPGFFAYAAALGPEGRYGQWLRSHGVVAQLGDTIFLHGGLSPNVEAAWDTSSTEAINRRVAFELERFDEDKAWLIEEGISLTHPDLDELFCALGTELQRAKADASPSARAREARLQEVVDRMPTADNWLSFNGEGPLWFRGFDRWAGEEGAAELEKISQMYDARRFVVGHTPQTGGLSARFDDRIFLIDVAMVFGGTPEALEIHEGQARRLRHDPETPSTPTETTAGPGSGSSAGVPWVHGTNGPQAEEEPADGPDAEPLVWLGADGQALPFDTDQLVEFLTTADVLSVTPIPVGVTKPKRLVLERNGLRSKAAFRYVEKSEQRRRMSNGKVVNFFRDSFINEAAAWELSRMLGMDTVPPAVVRRVRGQKGTVQMWVENALMEVDRQKDDIDPPDRLRFNRQFYNMRVFDNLINNLDRNQTNILFDQDWKLWMIDHTRAFSPTKDLPEPATMLGCSYDLFEAIKALDEDEVMTRLRPFLGKAEIRSLLTRRLKLIEAIEARIARRGEERVLFNWGDPDRSMRILTPEEDLPAGTEDNP